ncbi:hypothetical protein AT959_15170 [Dechloromonas denitrificans]|uniref:Cytochrome c domain-containing protein n=1 Tax=Dechloromonas denitrificans TaxID=281362 RepID=A0A133XED6_9RHOO|nr:hypothetical protein [Dechloromonas denitrificans]KXB29310.1 hypothetical protein AT959_15170 [Dechloromonas denitrificans]
MLKAAVCLVLLLAAAGARSADGNSLELGRLEYLNSCAVCHGADGRGQTPMATQLKAEPANLRLLAKRNGGNFPTARAYEMIDGRLAVPAHGGREMPVWGQRYTSEAGPAHNYHPYRTEAEVRSRILALIDYLYTLQD